MIPVKKSITLNGLLFGPKQVQNEHSTGPSVFYALISVSSKRLDSFIRYQWGKISKFFKTISLRVY